MVGRLVGIASGKAQYSGSLKNPGAMADLKMNRLLDRVDAWAQPMASTTWSRLRNGTRRHALRTRPRPQRASGRPPYWRTRGDAPLATTILHAIE